MQCHDAWHMFCAHHHKACIFRMKPRENWGRVPQWKPVPHAACGKHARRTCSTRACKEDAIGKAGYLDNGQSKDVS